MSTTTTLDGPALAELIALLVRFGPDVARRLLERCELGGIDGRRYLAATMRCGCIYGTIDWITGHSLSPREANEFTDLEWFVYDVWPGTTPATSPALAAVVAAIRGWLAENGGEA